MLNLLSLGDDLARGLGQHLAAARAITALAVVLLCGSATALAGPIVFVGLVVPHLARFIVGPDYRWILAYSAVLGPALLLAADIVGRLVVRSERARGRPRGRHRRRARHDRPRAPREAGRTVMACKLMGAALRTVPRASGTTATVRGRRLSRTGVIVLVLIVLVLVVAGASIAIGAYTLSLPELLRTLIGQGSPTDNFIVLRLRLPRVLLGTLVGAAFAVAGGLFQTLLRNPLASPDIIGISGGASVAAVFGILVLGLSGPAISLAAFAGAIVVALAIYLLAWRDGVSGLRFVLIGVGVAFMANAVLGYLITRGQVDDVSQALVWMVGSLANASWGGIAVLAVALVVLLPCVAALAPRLRMLQLGDETAGGLGVGVERTRLALILLAVVLVAAGTAFAGPIAFVAFVSAPIARRMLATGSLALVPSALVGILLVLASDLVAQHLLPGAGQVPVGIVTGIIGAPYLLWLLATTNRRGQGA